MRKTIRNSVGGNEADVKQCIDSLMAIREKVINKDVINHKELELILHEAADLLLMNAKRISLF